MNRLSLVLIAIIFYTIGASKIFAQSQVSFQQLSIKEGLSQNSAISVAQDSTGYLWIATQDGLNKYDGTAFKHYDKQFEDITRASYSKLGKVYVDRENVLWIITNSGTLEKFNRQQETFHKISSIKDVSAVFQDTLLNMYIGTYNNGLYKISHQTKDTIQLFGPKDRDKSISGFLQRGESVIITALNGIFSLDVRSNNYKPFIIPANTDQIYFSSISEIKGNLVFAGTYGSGLYYKTKTDKSFLSFKDLGDFSLPTNLNIQSVMVDNNNKLWIATYGQGAYLLDFELRTIHHFEANKNDIYSIRYNYLLCLFQDYTGTIWLGTDGAGLSYYDQYLLKFNVLTNNQTPNKVNVDQVRSIVVEKNSDNIWIGTFGKGLTKIDIANQDFQTYTKENSNLGSNRVVSLSHINNELWLGHQDFGLEILDSQGKYTTYSKNSKVKLKALTIWKIFEDSKKRVWLCTRENGLFLFDKNKGVLEAYTFDKNNPNSISSNNIKAITESDNGLLWLGTNDNGICSLDPITKSIKRYPKIKDKIKSLYYDKRNHLLWIGTFGRGLKSYNILTEEVHAYTTENGLPNNVVYGILPDRNNLWLSSNRGITKFSLQNLESPSILNYNIYDGLQSLEFNTGAFYKDDRGILYFGGLEGLNWFDPNQLRLNPIPPKTVITKLEVFSKEQQINQNEEFKYDQNNLTFSFAGLHYSLPERNNYQYQLLNYNDDWIQSGSRSSAHYEKLKPNTYTFKVKSSNYDMLWNEVPEIYTFTILQPWYFNIWAKFTYLFLILLAIATIYRYLKWRWRIKLDLRIKAEEAERFKELNHFKSKLYTDISHEFRTPLTLISGPIDAKLSQGKLSEYDFGTFTMIRRNTNRLLSLVDQLLDMAKLDAGSLKLKVFQGNLGLFLRTIGQSFEFQHQHKNIEYIIAIEDIKKVWYDEDIIEKICTNLLSNAFKYCSNNGICKFEAVRSKDTIQISVKNTAEYLSKSQLKNLFVRFYQKDEYAEGAGIGLALVRELVDLYKGEIVVNFDEDKIIDFKISLPIDKGSFRSASIIDNLNNVELSEETTVLKNNSATLIDEDTVVNEELPILLIVEDYADIRQFIKVSLKNKYTIFEAENGRDGIEKAFELVPDIIISDVKMPICDGIELCNTLKTDERTSHIPIILLTAGTGEENELKGLQSGADDFITKPFKLRILETRIANLIEIRANLRNRYSQDLFVKAKDIAISSTDEVFFKKIQKLVDEQMSNPNFNAAYFSSELGMSRMQLHRKLMVYTGLTTTAFIKSQRLKQAVHILKTSDATINEVAYTVGFNTPSYFIKCFKEVYESTPAEYLTSSDD